MKRTPLKRGTGLNRGSSSLSSRSELKSKSELRSNSELSSGSSLSSNSQLQQNSPLKSRSPIKNKPRQKTEEELTARRIVKQRSNGVCEICGRREATDMAHRVGAGVGGGWRVVNLLHACRQCHSTNHNKPQNAYDHGWHLRSYQTPEEEPTLLTHGNVKRWWLLDDTGKLHPSNPPECL